MDRTGKVKLPINGYSVIGKRIADAVACQGYGRRRLKAERAITNAHKGAWDAYADANAR